MTSIIIEAQSDALNFLRYAVPSGEFIYIFGPPSVGKTTVATESLRHYEVDVMSIYLNCNSIASSTKIYSEILKSIRSKLKNNRSLTRLNLDKLMGASEFAKLFQKLEIEAREAGYTKIYVLLDQVELFYKTPMMDTVVALSNTPDLYLMFTSTDSCDLFLTAINPDTSRKRMRDKMSVIELKNLTKIQIIELIYTNKPVKFEKLYRKFVTNIVNILYSNITNNLIEIETYCQENFENFLEFFKAKMNKIGRKENSLDPDETFDDDYLEEYTSKSAGGPTLGKILASYLSSIDGLKPPEGMKDFNKIDNDRKLNFTTGILCVAAFVAANTSPSEDKRNFVKFQKRKISSRSKSMKLSKTFSLERLLQIYKGLIAAINRDFVNPESKLYISTDHRNSVLSDVSSLEDRRMIELVTGDSLNPDSNYRLSNQISYAFVNRIAENFELDLKHLHGIKQIS